MLKDIIQHHQKLSPDAQKLVRTKKLSAMASPTELVEQWGEVHQYAQQIAKLRPDQPRFTKKKLTKALLYSLLLIPLYFLLNVYAKPLVPVLGWACVAALGVLVLLWWVLDVIPQINRKQLSIKPEIFDFIMPVLFLLQDELNPHDKISLRLDFRESNQRKFHYKVRKNYVVMPHRILLRWIPLAFSLYAVIRLFGLVPALFDDGFLTLGFFLTLFFYPFLILFAYLIFGKSPKVKTVMRQAPKVNLKAQLADGTLLQVSVHHVSMLTTAVKKKIKVKNYQSAKVKKKHKAKTVTTVKMAFAQKQYSLTKEAFKARFNKKPRILGRTIAKMKLKPGEKRNTVVYTDVVIKQGQEHQALQYTMPTFDWLVKLIMEGGYYPLKGAKPLEQAKPQGKSVPLDIHRDDLTVISGIGRATEAKLYGAGIFTFAQLADMSDTKLRKLLQQIGINPKHANHWQEQARGLA